eukprot:TRINITY_DN51407_c0_g1_i1.p1 TRINITY_DN51407_c0_g1~~TRINITY_DN51407_c0_g1_i1.p1  ORF type:complete len:421 (+),score=95.15 TRINITY_DN51407_c0_g1_i1:90-1352(+)
MPRERPRLLASKSLGDLSTADDIEPRSPLSPLSPVSPLSPTSSVGSGAYRRTIGHNVSRRESANSTASRASRLGSASARKRISKVVNFSEMYKLGGEVMPSTHSYIRLNFAKRFHDGEDCVVKIRSKAKGFRSENDERSWRNRMETLLNLPLPQNIGVCKMFEVLEDSEAFYIVMERVRGTDLFETLHGEDSVSIDFIRDVLRQLLTSVMHLHMNNLIHKDLKLENVMINTSSKRKDGKAGRKSTRGEFNAADAVVKLIDFDTVDEWSPKSPLSRVVVGTDQYIAQESYGGKYSPLSDMFAVGVIAYKMITKKFPFKDEVFQDVADDNHVSSPQMQAIRKRMKICSTNINYQYQHYLDHPHILDLTQRLLAYDEQKRPTAAAALQHPFFQDGHRLSLFPSMQRCDYLEDTLIDDDVIIAM